MNLQTPSGVVAVLLLPAIDPAKPAPPALVGAVLDQARQARINAELVVAVSPWGLAEEKELLAKARGAIHLLLGAGPGTGLRGLVLDEGRVAWVRGFERGKSLAVVTVPVLPGAGRDAKWLENDSISCESLPLDDSVASDQEVDALFEWLEQPR